MSALRLAVVVTVLAAGSISATGRSATTAPACPGPTGPGAYDTHLSPPRGLRARR